MVSVCPMHTAMSMGESEAGGGGFLLLFGWLVGRGEGKAVAGEEQADGGAASS